MNPLAVTGRGSRAPSNGSYCISTIRSPMVGMSDESARKS